MWAYQCDEEGFLLQKIQCQIDPLMSTPRQKKYIIPRNATAIEPPIAEEYRILRFVNNTWISIPDYRGCYVYQFDDVMKIETIGNIPKGWSLVPTPEYLALEKRNKFKLARKGRMESAVVRVGNYLFDADEDSINRMNSTITYLQNTGKHSIDKWTMADNIDVENLSIETLRRAFNKAVEYRTSIWQEQ